MIGSPPKITEPAVGFNSPVMALSVVDLPAPFEPMIVVKRLGMTEKLAPRTAWTLP